MKMWGRGILHHRNRHARGSDNLNLKCIRAPVAHRFEMREQRLNQQVVVLNVDIESSAHQEQEARDHTVQVKIIKAFDLRREVTCEHDALRLNNLRIYKVVKTNTRHHKTNQLTDGIERLDQRFGAAAPIVITSLNRHFVKIERKRGKTGNNLALDLKRQEDVMGLEKQVDRIQHAIDIDRGFEHSGHQM